MKGRVKILLLCVGFFVTCRCGLAWADLSCKNLLQEFVTAHQELKAHQNLSKNSSQAELHSEKSIQNAQHLLMQAVMTPVLSQVLPGLKLNSHHSKKAPWLWNDLKTGLGSTAVITGAVASLVLITLEPEVFRAKSRLVEQMLSANLAFSIVMIGLPKIGQNQARFKLKGTAVDDKGQEYLYKCWLYTKSEPVISHTAPANKAADSNLQSTAMNFWRAELAFEIRGCRVSGTGSREQLRFTPPTLNKQLRQTLEDTVFRFAGLRGPVNGRGTINFQLFSSADDAEARLFYTLYSATYPQGVQIEFENTQWSNHAPPQPDPHSTQTAEDTQTDHQRGA